jgi:ribosomal protein S18 acetylase RimI-like enzyme
MRERALVITGRESLIANHATHATVASPRAVRRDTVRVMVTVRRATSEDVARLANTATRAFADDPLLRWFFPTDDEYFELVPYMTAYMCRRWQATDSQWCTDDGVALAGWAPPGRPEVDVERPPITHSERRLAKFEALNVTRAQHTPGESHWYLNMLATHPDWQRQGIGAALMETVFAIADEQGLPCFLETETAANVAYYRHHGYEVRSEWDLGIDGEPGPHMWGMLRRPR